MQNDNEGNDSLYSLLQNALVERKSQLIDYMSYIEKIAKLIKNDQAMIAFFNAKKKYYYLIKDTTLPPEIHLEIHKLKQNIQSHYLQNYLCFYDILFIDTQGEIFYTIRKQKDYHKNIFDKEFSSTILSQKLMKHPRESFVDFQFYEISGEPSAFFIEPVFNNSIPIGWFVLQCSTNKINDIFANDNNLGSTGEVLLVNKNHFLLTDSRFRVEPTILKQELPSENIISKFNEKKGFKSVIDYRNKEVVSAFEVFNFFESEWLIIAKKDREEIETELYEKRKDTILKQITYKITNTEYPYLDSIPNITCEKKLVDMDEFRRTDDSTMLYTQGISTCTAISVIYPHHFAYLAHISPFDKIYNENRTDILKKLFKKISYFEITESEKENIQFSIACSQTKSLARTIQKIIDEGYFLSQIKVSFSPYAEYGNMYCTAKGRVYTEWILYGKPYIYDYSDINTIDKFKNSALLSITE